MDNPKKIQKQLNPDGSITFKDLESNNIYDFNGKLIAEGNLGQRKKVAKQQYIEKIQEENPKPSGMLDNQYQDIIDKLANQPEKLQELDKQVEDTYSKEFPTPDIATLKYFDYSSNQKKSFGDLHTKESEEDAFKTNPVKIKDYSDYINDIEDAYELRRQKDQSQSILETAKTNEDFNSDWYKQAKSKVDAIDENIVQNRIKANRQFADNLFITLKNEADKLGYIPITDERALRDQSDFFSTYLKANTNPWNLTEDELIDLRDRGLSFFRGFNNVLSSSLKGIALWGTKFDQLFQDMFQTGKTLDYTNSLTYKLGDLIETKRFNQLTKPDFIEHLSEGLGSMTGFIIGARFAGVARIGALGRLGSEAGNIGLLGGLSQTEQGYSEAKQYGASDTSALQSAMYNFAIGLSEEFPIEKFLNKLGKFNDLTYRELFREALVSGNEELIQESMSQLFQNITAKQLYDANRDLSEGVFQSGAVGLVSGFLMHGASTIGGNLINKRIEDYQSKIQQEEELKKQSINQSIIDAINSRIEFYQNQVKEEQEYLVKNQELLTASQKIAVQQVEDLASKEYNNQVQYALKSVDILNSDKASQIFTKGEKNNWSIDKVLSELRIPSEQIRIIKDIVGSDKVSASDREFIIMDLMSEYTKTVKINPTDEKNHSIPFQIRGEWYVHLSDEYDYESEHSNYITFDSEEEAKEFIKNDNKRKTYYSELTVPGGIDYSEDRITTPEIVPSIIAHAAFSKENDIGWFRSDKSAVSKNTRRVLEIQSDIFQKGRNREDLVGDVSLDGGPAGPFGPDYSFEDKEGNKYHTELAFTTDEDGFPQYDVQYYKNNKPISISDYQKGLDKIDSKTAKSKENSFLQLLNKNNNWIPFFIKSLIQEAKNRQYEKVWFPAGETAAKIEGHELISDKIKKIDKQIDEIESHITTSIYSGTTYYSWNNPNAYNEDEIDKDKSKVIARAIEILNADKQRYKTEGLDKLAPIQHFYENTIQNILRKNYEVNRVTDEFNNQWFEIDLSKIKDDRILLSKSNQDNQSNDQSSYVASSYYKPANLSEGATSHTEILSNISKESSNPFFRELATQLSKVVSDTKVEYFDNIIPEKSDMLQPGDKINMVYDKNENLIKINNSAISSKEAFERAYLHETIHSLTHKGLKDNPEFRAKIQELFDIASKRSKDFIQYFEDYNQGKNKLDEFLTHAFTDERIQKFLSQIEYNSKTKETFFDKFISLVKDFVSTLGIKIKDNSLLKEVIKVTGQHIESNFEVKKNIGSESKIKFIEDQSFGYRERTIKNASADATIALAIDFNSAGEKLTKSSVINQGKKYISIDANNLEVTPERVNKIVEQLNSVSAKTLNIAGNGIYTMKGKYTQQQVDDFTYNLLKEVINSPNLKTKIESIRTGGQTGFDEAGAKAGEKLGLPTTILAPKSWKLRNEKGQDISNEKIFKSRFSGSSTQSNSEIKQNANIKSSQDIYNLYNNLSKGAGISKIKRLENLDNIGNIDYVSQLGTERLHYKKLLLNDLALEYKNNDLSALYQFRLSSGEEFILTIPNNTNHKGLSQINSVKIIGLNNDFELKIPFGFKPLKPLPGNWEWNISTTSSEKALKDNIISRLNAYTKTYIDNEASDKVSQVIVNNIQNNLDKSYSRNLANTDIEAQFTRQIETNNPISNAINSPLGTSTRNDINSGGVTVPLKMYNLPNLVLSFKNSQGVPIFSSIEDALETVDEIYQQAEQNIKDGKSSYSKEREALQIWKDSFTGNNVLEQYSAINIHSLDNLEELNTSQKAKNGQDYLEYIWHNLRNKVKNSVYVLDSERGLVKQDYSYQEGGSNKSTVQDKRQWQVFKDWFKSELGIEYNAYELKIKDYEFINKDYIKAEDVIFTELQDFFRELDEQLWEQGLIAIYNEKEHLVFEVNSIKDSQGNKYNTQSMKMEDVIVDWTNTYWKSLLGDIEQSKLTKRLTALTGKASNNLITESIAQEIGYDTNNSIYIETDKNGNETGRVIANTTIFDTNTVSQKIKDSFSNWKKDMLADGAEFETQELHDAYNNLNGIDYTDRGMASKSKTIIPGKALFKSARFVVPTGSPLHQFMVKNNIARLTINSALKIDNNYTNTERLEWKTIEENSDFIDYKTYVFKHDIMQDTSLSSHGKVKNKARGTLASFMTTSLSAFANSDYRPALEKHLETSLTDLNEYMTSAKQDDFLIQELKDFISAQTDGYRTYLMDFVENHDFSQHSEFIQEPNIINFFLRNVLTGKIEDALSHQERAAYPALYPDLGNLTGFNKIKDADLNAFDENGFLKPGYFMLDKLSAQKNNLKKGDKALVGCNPPASIADLRGLTMASSLPNRLHSSSNVLENERGSKINTNYLIVNNEQFVGNSGKDFDIDKVIVVKTNTAELETIWNNCQKNDERLQQILSAFDKAFPGKDYIEKLQSIFGSDNKSINLNSYENINHFNKLLQTMEIGRVYNIKMYYQAILEATNNGEKSLVVKAFDSFGKEHTYTVIVNKENINSNLGILYHFTNMTLDWQSNQDLFKVNYEPKKISGHLLDIYENGRLLSKEYVDKEGKRFYPTGTAFNNIARTHLTPLRQLLRFQTDEDEVKLKGLLNQIQEAKLITDQKSNIFQDTTLFKSVKHFIDNFQIQNFGHSYEDIAQLLTNLKNDLTGKEDLNNLGYAKGKEPTRTAKLGEFFNKIFNLTLSPRTGYFTSDKALNPFGLQNGLDNTFALYQIHYFSKQFSFLNTFYQDLLTDLFDKKLYQINQNSTKKEVYWKTGGTKSYTKFFVTPINNGNLQFRKEEYSDNKLSKTKQYNFFKQMLEDTQGHSLKNAIKDSDGYSQRDLTDVFKFTKNRILGDYLNDKMFRTIVEFSEKESHNWTSQELELFYKSLFGVYDYKFNPADFTGKGYDNSLKSRQMGLQIGEELVYTDRVIENRDPITNELLGTSKAIARINNKFPAFRALQQVSKLNNQAGQIAKSVLDNVVTRYNEQLNKIAKLSSNDLPSIERAEDIVGQEEIKKTVIKESFENLLNKVQENNPFSLFQVASYFKKAENQVTNQDVENYLLNQVKEAYGFLEVQNDKTPTSKEVTNFLLSNYNRASQEKNTFALQNIYIREKLYDQQIKDYSNKNLTYTQNQNIVTQVSFQGNKLNLNLADILSDFRLSRMANEPALISGAMIDHSSRQAIDRKYRSISEDLNDLWFNIPGLFQSESKSETDLLSFDNNILQSQKLQKFIFEVSEQKDNRKILKDLVIEDGVFKYKDKVIDAFSYSGIDESLSKRTKLDISKILDLAETIFNDRVVQSDKEDSNYRKSIGIRAIATALVNRYIADYYVPSLLKNHLKDLDYYFNQALGLKDGDLKVEILNQIVKLKTKAEGYYSNYINKATELAKNNIRYMPHNFYSEGILMTALFEYYVKNGVSEENARKKAEELIVERKAEKDNIFNFLGLNMEHNFEHREYDFLDKYSHSLTEIYNYASNLVQYIHNQNLQVLENLNKRYLEKESTFIKRQRDFMSAVSRNKTVGIQDVEFSKIKKNDYILFIKKSTKQGYSDKVGRVLAINKKTGKFKIEDINGNIKEYSKYETIQLRKAFGITLTKKFVIATTGSEFSKLTDENVSYLVTTLVNARAKLLLGFDHIWFGARNYFGGRINLWSQFGSISNASDLFEKYQKLIENPANFKKTNLNEFLKVLIQNTGAIGGDITNAIERTGGIIENSGKYLSPDTLAYLNRTNKQWMADKAILKNLENELRSTPEDINWEKATELKDKIRFTFEKIDDFYKKHNLSNVVFGVLDKSRLNIVKHWNSAQVEKELRSLTAVVAANRVYDIFSEQISNARTEEQRKLIKDFALRMAGREIIKAINNTQFDYKKGFKTSTRDSTYLGRMFTQFRHYTQSQLSTYITGIENTFAQMKRFGFLNVTIQSFKKDSDLSYEVVISNEEATAKITVKDQNELAIFYRRTFANIVSSVLLLFKYPVTTFFGYLAGSVIAKAVDMLFIGQVAGSVNYTPVGLVLQAGFYWLMMQYDSFTYQDDDKNEKQLKKVLAALGEDREEWIKRTIDKARNKIGASAYQLEVEELNQQYNRELLKKFQMTIPLGIGESQIIELLGNWIINGTAPTNEMYLNLGKTVVPGLNILDIINTGLSVFDKQLYNLGNNPIDTKVRKLKLENNKIKDLKEKEKKGEISQEEKSQLMELEKEKDRKNMEKEKELKDSGNLKLFKSVTKEEEQRYEQENQNYNQEENNNPEK